MFNKIYVVLLFGSKLCFGRILDLPNRAKFGGVQAFGYNSIESEQIWMKSGAFVSTLLGLALADFGRDLRSSESLRGRQIFFVW